jgi:hypothetical protein
MNRMTSRQAVCWYFSTSEGKSYADVFPEAAGSQNTFGAISSHGKS